MKELFEQHGTEATGMAEYIEREGLINNRPEGRNPKQFGKEEYNKGWNDCRSASTHLLMICQQPMLPRRGMGGGLCVVENAIVPNVAIGLV